MHTDPRRPQLVNGAAYRRQAAVIQADNTSFLQTICSALALGVFVVGGLMMIVALA